jgi:hypothetical protein
MGVDSLLYLLEKTPKGDASIKIPQDLDSKFYYNSKSSKLYILIPRWKGRLKLNTPLARDILKKGSCLAYKLPDILSRNPNKTLKYINSISNFIKRDIKDLNKKHNFKDITLVGLSLGTVPGLIVANNIESIKRVILVSLGHCLAEAIWAGKNTQYLRKAFENKKIKLSDLKQKWKSISPENNIDNLNNKDIYVHLSKSDSVVPYFSGKSLIDSMKKNKLEPIIRENRSLGHCLTLLGFEYFPKDL